MLELGELRDSALLGRIFIYLFCVCFLFFPSCRRWLLLLLLCAADVVVRFVILVAAVGAITEILHRLSRGSQGETNVYRLPVSLTFITLFVNL